MEIILAGLLLWSLTHLTPSLAPPVKRAWVNKLGQNGYKLSFTVLILLSLIMIVYGWRHTTPTYLYPISEAAKPVALILMVIAFVIMGATNYQTRIKRQIRHPQLTGVIIWSVAHLAVNGDSRSILLFGGLGIWAALEILFINRRDGEWIKPVAPSWGTELKGLIISLVVFVVVVLIHPYIAGVPVK